MDRRAGPIFRTGPKNTPYGILTLLGGCSESYTFVNGVKRSLFKGVLASVLSRVKVSRGKLVISPCCGAALTFIGGFRGKSHRFSFCHRPKTSVVLGTSRITCSLVQRTRVFRFNALSVASRAIERTAVRTVTLTGRRKLLVSFSPGLHPPL